MKLRGDQGCSSMKNESVVAIVLITMIAQRFGCRVRVGEIYRHNSNFQYERHLKAAAIADLIRHPTAPTEPRFRLHGALRFPCAAL